MATLNYSSLNINVGKLRVVRDSALELAESKVSSAKSSFLESFTEHEVTKEIEGGADSANSSGTLGGYANLFSFIGFENGDRPTEIVKNLINKIRLVNRSYRKVVSDSTIISFEVSVPSISDFENATPVPWAKGTSWLIGIERGISGFGYFISRIGLGRSSGGIQSDSKIRGANYSPTKYFSKMYNDFIKKIRGGR